MNITDTNQFDLTSIIITGSISLVKLHYRTSLAVPQRRFASRIVKFDYAAGPPEFGAASGPYRISSANGDGDTTMPRNQP